MKYFEGAYLLFGQHMIPPLQIQDLIYKTYIIDCNAFVKQKNNSIIHNAYDDITSVGIDITAYIAA
jgi:hypothetical protein